MRFYSVLVIGLVLLSSCGNSRLTNNEEGKDSITFSKETCIDSLLKHIIRPSKIDLPMQWKYTIYDTCQTTPSLNGRYVVFVGRTDEDKVLGNEHLIEYGLLSKERRVSVFLYDNEKDNTTLLATTNSEGFGLYEPQIDKNSDCVYYFREDHRLGMSLFRYFINTHQEEYLTSCDYSTTYLLQPNGNILFKIVREDIAVWDSTVYKNEEDVITGWLGYVFCDIEMSPSGVCKKKSKFYTIYGDDENTLTYDIGDWGIINNDSLQQKWIDSLQETQYFNKRGECVGVTSNSIESYNGWRGLEPKKQP